MAWARTFAISVAGYETPAPIGASRWCLTREAFDQFCRSTGLGSDVLVGKGENLASLVFYIAIHGVFSSNGVLTRHQVLDLLHAARECCRHLDESLSLWRSKPDLRATHLLKNAPVTETI